MSEWESAPADTSGDSEAPWGAATNGDCTSEHDEAGGVTISDQSQLSKEEDLEKAKAAGWVDPTAIDYDAIQRLGTYGEFPGAAAKYEWKDDFGDVAPKVPELEKILFNSEFSLREGKFRKELDTFDVEVRGPEDVKPINAFDDAALHPVMRDNINLCQYKYPTAIQAYSIPAISLGHDVVATAHTGSGKTAAYLIPIISKLMGKAKKLAAKRPDQSKPGFNPKLQNVKAEPVVLIIVPTRELAIQVFDETRRLCYRSMLRPCVAYGGLPMRENLEDLGKGCDILIGSPGRLCDLTSKADVLTMERVKFTVIDEADELLNDDWETELRTLLISGDSNEDADHQYMMFSATFPAPARKLAREYMEDKYFRMRVGRFGSTHKNVNQVVIEVDQNNKKQATYDLLFASDAVRTLIFCNAKPTVDLLDDYLFNRALPSTSIHADRTQREREDAIRNFRVGKAPILIATGVSSRGLDIKDVKHVINYDLPSEMHGGINEYVHRIGRTARMGHKGLATSFYNDRNEDIAGKLAMIMKESGSEVPDFLAHHIPEDGVLDFQDDSEDEAETGGFGGEESTEAGTAWGARADGNGGAEAAPGWGAPPGDAAPADCGFTAAPGVAVTAGW